METRPSNYYLIMIGGTLSNHFVLSSASGSRLQYIAVDDLNNDADLDMIVANYNTGDVDILFSNSDGTFQDQIKYKVSSNTNPYSLALCDVRTRRDTLQDFNNDGQIDVAAANRGGNNIAMMLGNDNGTFREQIIFGDNFSLSPLLVVAGDFDDNGRSEIALIYDQTDSIDLFFSYDTGNFTEKYTYDADALPVNVATGDFNNDTYLDAVVVNHWAGTFSIYLERADGSFTNQTEYDAHFYSDSVAVCDLDNDKALDIVITNNLDDTTNIF
ncbi:unnamed protein product [Adineta ricciae]|uniref:VCBS repeat-containing protein n=1 Tax=Adineta ricciae TaxID=249248 RepID=A0A815KSF6_ADIRI|nr:unnamed protein product [Adineta ricciae]